MDWTYLLDTLGFIGGLAVLAGLIILGLGLIIAETPGRRPGGRLNERL